MSNSKYIVERFNTVLIAQGFRRNGMQWSRSLRDVRQSLELQKSGFGGQYFLNIGLWLIALGDSTVVKDKDMHIRIRSDSLVGKPSSDCLNLETGLDVATRNACIAEMLVSVVAILDTWSTLTEVASAVTAGALSRAFVLAPARALLSSTSEMG